MLSCTVLTDKLILLILAGEGGRAYCGSGGAVCLVGDICFSTMGSREQCCDLLLRGIWVTANEMIIFSV